MQFRDFLASYRKERAEDVFIVDEASRDLEPTAYATVLRKSNPLICIERIREHPDSRMVLNVFGKIERIAYSVGMKTSDLPLFWRRMLEGDSQPSIVSDGPVREVTMKGDSIRLESLPAPLHYPQDGGRYLSGGLVASLKPDENRTVNLSYARAQIIDDSTLAMSMHSRGHLWSYFQQYKSEGRKMPVSIIIGANTALYMAAAARIEGEYEKVSSVEPIKLVDGIMNDVPAPFDSEIVIEAEVYPDRELDEGPFSEYTGYMTNRSTRNYAKVTCISMRSQPIFLDIVPSNSTEHILLSSLAKELTIADGVYTALPPSSGFKTRRPISGTHYVALALAAKPEPGLAKQVGLALLGSDHYLKLVIVNEGVSELNLFNLLANAAAHGTNLPRKDVEILDGVFCNRLDPSGGGDGIGSKAIWVTRGDGAHSQHPSDAGLELRKDDATVFLGHVESESDHHKVSVILDVDIDPTDEDEVLWAIATRCQPSRDFHFLGARLVIDCRKPAISMLRPSLPRELVISVENKVRLATRNRGLQGLKHHQGWENKTDDDDSCLECRKVGQW